MRVMTRERVSDEEASIWFVRARRLSVLANGMVNWWKSFCSYQIFKSIQKNLYGEMVLIIVLLFFYLWKIFSQTFYFCWSVTFFFFAIRLFIWIIFTFKGFKIFLLLMFWMAETVSFDFLSISPIDMPCSTLKAK